MQSRKCTSQETYSSRKFCFHILLLEDKFMAPDRMYQWPLREITEIILRPLSTILDPSGRLGEAPEDLRKVNVTATFKKGKNEDPGIYRLVTLTLISTKVLNILHCFTCGKSCLKFETSLMKWLSWWTWWEQRLLCTWATVVPVTLSPITVPLSGCWWMSKQWSGLKIGWICWGQVVVMSSTSVAGCQRPAVYLKGQYCILSTSASS